MKPVEILSMLEEAAGTKMYEKKKQSALTTIEKKDSKLKEINDVIYDVYILTLTWSAYMYLITGRHTYFQILKEEIGPKLNKLKEERMQYVEFQRIERELEHSKRIYIAWKYMNVLSNSQKAEDNVEIVQSQIDSKLKTITIGEEEMKNIEEKYNELWKIKEAVCDSSHFFLFFS